ncbi:MAG: NAD(P)/FAD-dependent oxidoreductase [Chloroflexi bacterium]|nr:NAD(P)/FAD-dependent oxidoreductase [Chloroflexota bacterium]
MDTTPIEVERIAAIEADIVVAGAGVVGLAVAARLASPSRRLLLIEKNPSFGQETSSRHSGVIHGGLYYREDCLKTRLCVRGREMLYETCQKHGVPFRKCGKLVVASSPGEKKQLETLCQQGIRNGVTGLEILSQKEFQRLEPCVAGVGALMSPETGIIDSHALMGLFLRQARGNGATPAFRTEVTGIERQNSRYRVVVRQADGSQFTFNTRIFVNCCGLYSDRVAGLAGIDIGKAGYRLHYCKGDYFSLSREKSRLVKMLVYPVPEPSGAGLGIHLTPDLEERVRLGPDAHYVSSVSYEVDPAEKEAFWKSARLLLPEIGLEDLEPESSGIRPKLQGPGDGFRDFVIHHEADRGFPGVISLVGIESPGLTSCMAIAEMVAGMVRELE